MKQFSKRFTALLIACAALLACTGGALAYDADKALTQAEALNALGLLQGTNNGYELDRAPTRMDSLVMLLRMTGVESNARFFEGEHPFVDAPHWSPASAYLAVHWL